jgi:hypothetical protein
VKLVPYTVMVPEHYAVFMEEMNGILIDFKYSTAMEFVDAQVFTNEMFDFRDAIEWAVDGWDFDKPEDRARAERQIAQACRKLVAADKATEKAARGPNDPR